MYVRQFLNEPGHHGGAYLLLSVPDTEGVRGRYVDSTVHFEIADCARNVQLEFPLHDAAARRNRADVIEEQANGECESASMAVVV